MATRARETRHDRSAPTFVDKSNFLKRWLDDPQTYPDEFKAWLRSALTQDPNIIWAPSQIPNLPVAKIPTLPAAKVTGLVAADTDWHYVGGSGEPAFQNGWVNYGAPYGGARFRKLASGLVVLDGLISTGTIGAAAFTLPVGYRPGPGAAGAVRDHIFIAAAGGAHNEGIRIQSDNGQVRPIEAAAATWISLDQVIFLGF